jgi:hypothetical protein
MKENMMNSQHLTSTKESRDGWDSIKWNKDSKSYTDARKCNKSTSTTPTEGR